jgi:hypothetical protein
MGYSFNWIHFSEAGKTQKIDFSNLHWLKMGQPSQNFAAMGMNVGFEFDIPRGREKPLPRRLKKNCLRLCKNCHGTSTAKRGRAVGDRQ